MHLRKDRVKDKSDRVVFVCALLPILAAVFVASLGDALVPDLRARALALVLAAPAWWLAVRLARDGAGDLRVVVGGAIALRLLALAGEVRFSDDIHRYVWEGLVLRSGASPYALSPSAPELADLAARHPELHARVNHRAVPAAYPPLTQAAGLAAVTVADWLGSTPEVGGVLVLRTLFALCDLALLWPLTRLLSALGRPRALAVAWGWSPLLAIEFAGSGHFDSLGVMLLVASLACLTTAGVGSGRVRDLTGSLLLAGAILTKYLPLVALPALMRGPTRARRAIATLAVCALAFAPFLCLDRGASGLLGGLREYGLRWESTNLVYRFFEAPFAGHFVYDETWTDPRRLGRLCAAGAWFAFALVTWVRRTDALRATAAVLGAFLVLSPTLHPWYLAWIAPFVALRPAASWGWLLATAPLFYWPLERWRSDGQWIEPVWLWPIVALPFFALLIRESWTSARAGHTAHSGAPTSSGGDSEFPLDTA